MKKKEEIEFRNKEQKAMFLAMTAFVVVMGLTMLFVNQCTTKIPENKPIICKEQCEKQNMTYYNIINDEQCSCKNKENKQIVTIEIENKNNEEKP